MLLELLFCLLSAVAFKNAKLLEEAKDAYLQEAEAHTNNKTYPFTSYWISVLLVILFNLYDRVSDTMYSVC